MSGWAWALAFFAVLVGLGSLMIVGLAHAAGRRRPEAPPLREPIDTGDRVHTEVVRGSIRRRTHQKHQRGGKHDRNRADGKARCITFAAKTQRGVGRGGEQVRQVTEVADVFEQRGGPVDAELHRAHYSADDQPGRLRVSPPQ